MIIKVPARALTQLYTPKVDDVCSTLYSVSGTNEHMGLLDHVVSRLDLVLCEQQLGFNWKSLTWAPFIWVSYEKKLYTQLYSQLQIPISLKYLECGRVRTWGSGRSGLGR